MADINKVNNGGVRPSLNQNQIPDADLPDATRTSQQTNATNIPVGQPGESAQSNVLPQTVGEKLMPDVITGRDRSQLDAAEQLRAPVGVSATDKLLGLHLQPTIAGAFAAPPGNVEVLRHLAPAARRNIVRNLLTKQRERTRRLARVVRDQRDEQSGEDDAQNSRDEESFYNLLGDGRTELTDEQVNRATEELVKMARMLDLLDEMLVLQDYTLSQMGTFAQG